MPPTTAPEYQYDFANVEQYLHHRPPYLMVDGIEVLDSTSITTIKHVTGEEFFFPGHFPGAPVFPGAMLQEVATQSAGILIAARHNPMSEYETSDPLFNEYALGVLVRVRASKFRGFVRPGDTIRAQVELIDRLNQQFEFRARLTVGDRMVMRQEFQLANIRSEVLQGVAGVGAPVSEASE